MGILRKIWILVIISLLPLIPLSAQSSSSKYSFSLTPFLGFFHGQAEEIVYELPGEPQYLSLLLWDLKPLLYVGFSVDFGPRNPFKNGGFLASSSIKLGLPNYTGLSENFDWLSDGDDYSHYSRHEAYTQRSFLADILFGYSWRLMDSLALRTYGEFAFMHFSWQARDGIGEYPFGGMMFIGTVVEYLQNWFIFSPGISIEYRFFDFISLEGNFSYSPLVFCIARDHHTFRDTVFYDYPRWGHSFKWGGSLIVSPTPNVSYTLSFTQRLITGSRGDSYIGDFRYRDVGGAGISGINLSMGARFYFGKGLLKQIESRQKEVQN